MLNRRQFNASALALYATAATPVLAQAAYPNRPVKLIVPFAPGGGPDIMTRKVAPKLADILGQNVVVENVVGAGGILAGQTAARAAPDGYTILLGASTHITQKAMLPNVKFDPLKDFAPITQVSLGSVLLTAPGTAPYNDLKGFIAWAAQQKRPISFGTWGIGSSAHIYGEILRKEHGVDLNHVPYKGELPAITDVIGGNLDITFSSPVGARPQVAAGKLKALAMAGPARSAAMPEVPTFGEQGFKGFELAVWVAAYAPAGTPAAIVERLQREIAAIIRLPDVAPKLVDQGQTPLGNTPAEFEASFRDQAPRWEALIRASGAKAQ